MMKKTILFISPGPIFRPKSESYQAEYKMFSKKYRGYIFTTSSVAEEICIDNFSYFSMKSEYTMISNVKFIFFCIRKAISLLKQGKNIDLVVTYDPIKTGLIGLFLSYLHKAKFAPRVNGVYTSEAEWVDEKEKLSTKIKKNLYPLIIRFVLKHADGIKLLFEGQIQPFDHVVFDKIIKIYPSYVAVDEFYDIRRKNEILFVGFPFKRKGADILIVAFKKIAPKYPEWKLKILGWFPNLKELNEAIGEHPQIYYHKPVHHNEMVEHIGSCSVLVLPSRSEAMGRVLVEAMAAGKPRIGSNVDGIPTVINDGVDGYLVEPGNVEDLANKLEMLISDKELRRKLGKNAGERAMREFTKEIYYRNSVSFYDEILGS